MEKIEDLKKHIKDIEEANASLLDALEKQAKVTEAHRKIITELKFLRQLDMSETVRMRREIQRLMEGKHESKA